VQDGFLFRDDVDKVIVGWALPAIPPSHHLPIANTTLNSLPYPQKLNDQRAYNASGAIILTLGTFNRSARMLILTWDIMNAGYSRLFYDFRS
jgi:hypothetical protein